MIQFVVLIVLVAIVYTVWQIIDELNLRKESLETEVARAKLEEELNALRAELQHVEEIMRKKLRTSSYRRTL